MAKEQVTAHRDEIAGLLADGRIDIPGYHIVLIPRDARRLVIQILTKGESTSWVDGVCDPAAFSQLQIIIDPKQSQVPTTLSGFIEALFSYALSATFEAITLCAREACAYSLMSIAPAFAGATCVLADLPDGFEPPSGKALKGLGDRLGTTYILFDPFHDPQTGLCQSLQGENVHYLKCFGMGQQCLHSLWRMKVLQIIQPGLLSGETAPDYFYKRLRIRKNFPLYRKGIESALIARGQPDRAERFRKLFKDRLAAAEPEAKFERLKARAEAERPSLSGAWVRAGKTGTDTSWPSAGGNIWMLDSRPAGLRYMSDRWEKITIGYEERGGVTLAQTPPLALATVGFGGDAHVPRSLSRRFRWHVIDEMLDGTGLCSGPLAEATLASERRYAIGDVLHTILAISQPQPGITAGDTTPDAAPYKGLLAKVAQACAAMQDWDKSLFIDRLRLGLLRGDQTMVQQDAALHYAATAARMVADLAQVTGQAALPLITITQGAGTRDNGRIEAVLAEGRFDIDNPGIRSVVATPAYPWPLMDDTPATPTSHAALIMDELCDLAVSTVQAGQRWFCPSLQIAHVSGHEILAEFSSLDGLVLEQDVPHGFALDGAADLPPITKAEVVSDRMIRLELPQELDQGAQYLTYAWGHTQARAGYAANHGGLRDRWQATSITDTAQILHRYALSGRVPLLRGR